MTCGCPAILMSMITDSERHTAWHALVIAQGGPVGEVNIETLRLARGTNNSAPASRTLIDVRKKTGRRT